MFLIGFAVISVSQLRNHAIINVQENENLLVMENVTLKLCQAEYIFATIIALMSLCLVMEHVVSNMEFFAMEFA